MTSLTDNDAAQYLTEQYVENFLRKYFKDSTLKVTNMFTKPASAKGESYCSVISRMSVNYKSEQENKLRQIDFIVKSIYNDNPYLADILRQYDVYNTEMQLYETVFPQLQQMLQEIGDNDELFPKAIHVDYESEIIILEDLMVRKYGTANRLTGMDEVHLKLCLKKLAKMHATAAVLNERRNGLLEKYSHGIYNRHVSIYGEFVENVMEVSAKFAESCPELGIYYRDKLLKLIPHAVEYVTRCYDPNPKHFLTLSHGDVWTNNVMVQYSDAGNKSILKDVLLIDFQYCSWTSPAVDLHYFFTTSAQDDLYLTHQPQFIQYYHGILMETLEKLEYKNHIPTLHELNVQLLERKFYAVSCLLVNFPLLINDKTEDADLETLLGTDEKAQRFRSLLYTNKRVQNLVKIMLPRFDKMGLLDVVK